MEPRKVELKKIGKNLLVKYNDLADLNRHHKKWAGKVVGSDPKYKFGVEWMKQTWIDEKVYLLFDLKEGDVIRIHAGSYKNDYGLLLKVVKIEDLSLFVQAVSEEEVLSSFESVNLKFTEAKD